MSGAGGATLRRALATVLAVSLAALAACGGGEDEPVIGVALYAGERLDAATVAFSLAVIATVFLGKKMPTHRPNRIQRTGEKP